MKKVFVLASAALVTMTLTTGPVAAISFSEGGRSHYHKPKPPKPGHGVKGPSALGQYVLFSTFCAAGSLIVQSAYVGETENRELTSQEAFYTTGNCFLPIVGGPLFWALANGGNPN